jgi:hypothetical protein
MTQVKLFGFIWLNIKIPAIVGLVIGPEKSKVDGTGLSVPH